MKFSYNLIKKLAPGKYSKEELVEKLNLHSFETADLGEDVLEISVTPNRYADAASHLGIAREAAAIFNLKLQDPSGKIVKSDAKDRGLLGINIKEKKLCRRYVGAYIAGVKVGQAPSWMKEILESCGLRSINNVVDIMNYVMLELGQPMHAFDADKISGGIIVRKAKKGESMETIDGNNFVLYPENLIIADAKKPLAIAGIKGGKSSEVAVKTKNIFLEAANFEGGNIYRSSKRLGLVTDASVRFSHQASPESAFWAMNRALQLIKETAGGKVYKTIDVYSKKQSREVIKVDSKKINNLIGHDFSEKEIWQALQALGFKKNGRTAEVPWFRPDVRDIEDLAEEVIRLRGYDSLASHSPKVALGVASEEDQIILKDRIRSFLAGAGASEVYNYSFLSEKEVGSEAVELANPMSNQYQFLRDSLKPDLIKNLESNKRFFDAVRIFEIGKVFLGEKSGVTEKLKLGVGISSKDSYLELKGLLDSLLGSLGITDYNLVEKGNYLKIHIDGSEAGSLELVSGLRQASIIELDLDLLLKNISEEKEFKPLSKFPSITRDLSIYVPNEVRVGGILDLIQRVSSKLVQDVDLIDFYEPVPAIKPAYDKTSDEEKKKGLTFRIVFQAEDRTLTDAEADREMAIINKVLIDEFDAELR